MTPREFLKSKGFLRENIFIYNIDGKPHNVPDLLQEYTKLETEELNKLLDKQIDTFLTPEKQQELIELIKDESNLKTKE